MTTTDKAPAFSRGSIVELRNRARAWRANRQDLLDFEADGYTPSALDYTDLDDEATEITQAFLEITDTPLTVKVVCYVKDGYRRDVVEVHDGDKLRASRGFDNSFYAVQASYLTRDALTALTGRSVRSETVEYREG